MRVRADEGVADKAIPAPRPLWDRISSRSLSDKEGNNSAERNWPSTLLAASCCQPCLWLPGSWSSGLRGRGRRPAARADQDGTSNPSVPSNSAGALLADSKHGSWAKCPPNLPSRRPGRSSPHSSNPTHPRIKIGWRML